MDRPAPAGYHSAHVKTDNLGLPLRTVKADASQASSKTGKVRLAAVDAIRLPADLLDIRTSEAFNQPPVAHRLGQVTNVLTYPLAIGLLCACDIWQHRQLVYLEKSVHMVQQRA